MTEPETKEVEDADPLTQPVDLQTTGDYTYPNPAAVDTMAPEDDDA
jgi:hypothetical protein